MQADAFDTRVQVLPTLDISPCKLRRVAGLRGRRIDISCQRTFGNRDAQESLGMAASRAIGFTIEPRIPPRGFNDVNLMKRQAS
jgi:hypothetical protein